MRIKSFSSVCFLASSILVGVLLLLSTTFGQSSSNFPEWIKNNAGWWADGLIKESEFLDAMKFLIERKIIPISVSKDNLLPPNRATHTLPDSRNTEFVEITGSFTEKHVGPLTLTVIKPDKSEDTITTISRNGNFMTTMALSSNHPIGTYKVFAEIKGNLLFVYSFDVTDKDSNKIPEWIKSNSKMWSKGEIGDGGFADGLKYLVENRTIQVDIPPNYNTEP